MNYNENMLKFTSKETAEKYIKLRCSNLLTKKGKKDIIENIKRILGFSSWMYSIEVVPNIFAGYKTESGEYEAISLFDNIPGFTGIDMLDSFIDKNSSPGEKVIIQSTRLSYHFLIGNYQKVEKVINEIMEDEDTKYRDISFTSYTRINTWYIQDTDISKKEKNLQNCRAYIVFLYSGRKFSKDGYFKNAFQSYLNYLNSAASEDAIEELLSNKFMRIMHEKVMHDYGELGGTLFIRNKQLPEFFSSQLSILDTFESRPDVLKEFLYQFPNDPEKDGWNKITSKTDYRLSPYIKELKDNKERLLKIFQNYLYSTYALGQRHSKLEDILRQMSNMLEIIGFEDINILEIVEDLPDKIQRFALTAMIGE